MFERFFASLMTALALCTAGSAFAQQAPDALIKQVSIDVIDTIKADKSIQAGDVQKINALVETKVVDGSGRELPIDYQLHNVNGQWKVYDMVIDHISIVNNYRAQFDRVIAKSSIKELLERMKEPSSS